MEKQLKLYVVTVLLLYASFIAQSIAYAEPPNEDASAILDRTYEAYAKCRTYRDSGFATDVTHDANGKRTNQKAIAIAFVRPNKFRYEYVADDHKYIIWMDGDDIQKWWTISGKAEKVSSLGLAVGAAVGVSRSSSVMTPSLLEIAGVRRRDLIRHEDVVRIGDSRLGELDCFRLTGMNHSWDTTLWIEKSTYLVRQIEMEQNVGTSRRSRIMTFSPIVDQPVDNKLLEFNHP